MKKKPFIKLFRTPNCNYFYDVNRSEFVEISDDSFQYLHDIMSDSYEPGKLATITQELQALEAEGYLSSESNVREVKHPYTDYLEIFLERKVSMLTLQVTQDCNFRCRYCIYSESANERQRGHSREKMNWETAKKALDFFWERSVDSPKVSVGFYGGEPLLEFDLIKKSISYAKKLFLGKNITFNMTTNGTLLTNEMIQYLNEQNVSLMVSLDGPKKINDINRVFVNGDGTFDSIMAAIERVKAVSPEYVKKLQVSMVINPESDYDCINEVVLKSDVLENQNLSMSMVDFDYDDREPEMPKEYFEKSEYQRFLALLSNFGRFPKNRVQPIAERMIETLFDESDKFDNTAPLYECDAPSGPCIPGQLRLFVNVYGDFYPCERVSETSQPNIIGNLDVGFDTGKAKAVLNICKLSEDECKECWAFRKCTICVKKVDDGEKFSKERKLKSCRGVEIDAYNKIRSHLLLKEISTYYKNHTQPTILEV